MDTNCAKFSERKRLCLDLVSKARRSIYSDVVTFILVEKNEQKREDGTKCCREKGERMPRFRKEKELTDT